MSRTIHSCAGIFSPKRSRALYINLSRGRRLNPCRANGYFGVGNVGFLHHSSDVSCKINPKISRQGLRSQSHGDNIITRSYENNELRNEELFNENAEVKENGADVKSKAFPDHIRKLIAPAGGIILMLALNVCQRSPAVAVGNSATVRAGTSTAVAAAGGKAARFLLQTEFLSSAWTGLVAGFLHTLTGPDHLAALAPLSIGRSRIESAAVGALWGCGHDAGQVIFGIAFLLLKDKLQIELLRAWGARVVGVTLLAIGLMGIKEAMEAASAFVALESGAGAMSNATIDNVLPNPSKNNSLATFATGIVHGLQPDALLMILPALALPSRLAGAAFLGMFLVGTIVAMGSYTAFIGSCSTALKKKVPRITEGLSWGSSIIAIALGVAVLLSEFFGINLF